MEIHIEITSRCPLKCLHCSSWTLREQKTAYRIEDICELIYKLHETTDVYFTGGEPLLCEQIISTIKSMRKNPFVKEVGLFTTGQYILQNKIVAFSSEYCSNLKDAGLTVAYVSLYGTNKFSHEALTQSSGSLERTMKSIQIMLLCGIEVRLNVVVYKNNIDSLNEIISYANSVGISEVRLLKLINHGNAHNNWNNLSVDNVLFMKEASRLTELCDNKTRITVSGFPEIVPCRPYKDALLCQAGKKLLYIDIRGNVFPCACVKNNTLQIIANIENPEKIKDFVSKREDYYYNCLAGLQ